MSIAAIICEYNPMHKGHIYQISKIKAALDNPDIICVMSGHFVQRGGAAIFDKWTRAKIAAENGADLVLQLPEYFSSQSAEIFAKGAVNLINDVHIASHLCFSAESKTGSALDAMHDNFKQNQKLFNIALQKYLEAGLSYPVSLAKAAEECGLETLKNPNDILGFEYVKALKARNSSVKPFVIKRDTDALSSAAIRKLLHENTSLAHFHMAGDTAVSKHCVFSEDFLNLIKYAVLSNQEKLEEIFEINEGLENILLKSCQNSSSLDEIIMRIKSKRYTYAKIQRILFNVLLDVRKTDIERIKAHNFKVPYARILAFTENGRRLIKNIKENSDLQIINKAANYTPPDDYSKLIFDKDIYATEIYNIISAKKLNDFKLSPVYAKL